MLKIYLARHGQDEDNYNGVLNGHRDNKLTSLGQKQAEELATKIKEANIKIDKVYSSPLQRAYCTAEKVSDLLKINKPEKLDNLIERDFGVMTGKLISEIEDLCSPDILKTKTITYFLSPEGAETFPDLINRANQLLNFIKEKHKNQNILLVTHGDIGKMIYATYYNLDWPNVLKDFHFGNSELLLLSPDSSPEDSHVFSFAQHNL